MVNYKIYKLCNKWKSNYEYNDSYIINSHENYNEIENNQYNN